MIMLNLLIGKFAKLANFKGLHSLLVKLSLLSLFSVPRFKGRHRGAAVPARQCWRMPQQRGTLLRPGHAPRGQVCITVYTDY